MLNNLPILIIGFVITLTLFITIKHLFSISPKHHKKFPPSPPTLPILGNLHQIGENLHRSLRRLSQLYGPLMHLKFGARNVLIVSSPDAAAEIMKTHDAIFSNRPERKIAYKLLYQGKDMANAQYGEYWRQIRSVCAINLLGLKRVQSYRALREEETESMAEAIRKLAGSPINLSEMFASLTVDLFCRVAFGKKFDDGVKGEIMNKKFRELLVDFMELLGSYSVGDYIPCLSWINKINGFDARADRVAKDFDEFLDEIVDEHMRDNKEVKGDEERKDFVDLLLEVQKERKMDGGFYLDRVRIKAIILDMFAAGTHTTYTAIEWTMTELLRHPQILKKLQEEVTQIAGGILREISESDLDKMHYLKAVIKETLRLYPPVPTLAPRESAQDVKIKGFDIAKGTMVIINAWSFGRDPDFWDQPEVFMPERFLNSDIDYKLGNDHFQYIPFGAGRRGCPGILFAMATIESLLANLVNNFDWKLPNGMRGEDLDMSECVGLAMQRKVPLFAVATPRVF